MNMMVSGPLREILEAPALSPEIAARRVSDPAGTRSALLAQIKAISPKHYVLHNTLKDEVYVLMPARDLRGLIPWFAKYPRLATTLRTTTQRAIIKTGESRSVALLRDDQVLGLRSMRLTEAKLVLYVYERARNGNFTCRVRNSPMRELRIDDLDAPFYGYCYGQPVCAVSPEPITPPDEPVIAPPTILRAVPVEEASSDTPDGVEGGEPLQEVAALIGEVPIDVVYTWVNSDDPAWQARFAEHVGKATTTTHASELRFLSRDELKYSVRSVLKFAPWVRNIFIVTDRQVPDWFRENPKIKIVDHSEIFPDPSVLPVFNSHAIESCLHRIEGLAEHYIYFNDDVFLGKPTKPTHFFDEAGSPRLFFSSHLSFAPEWIAQGTLPTDYAFRSTIRIIRERFGFTPCAKVLHTPHPMRRSVLEMIEREHGPALARTRAARIRSETDLNVTGNLAYYYSLGLGMAAWMPASQLDYLYMDTGRRNDILRMLHMMRQKVTFYCLNLTHYHEVPRNLQARLMKGVLTYLVPQQAMCEKPTVLGRILKVFARRPKG